MMVRSALSRMGIFTLILMFFYMSTHRPNEEQFYIWLLDEYNIECNKSITCSKKIEGNTYSTLIETGSNIKNGYLLFNTIGKIYEDENGSRTTIKALGILGKYFTIMKDEQDR
ncbi:hypothetical protein [Rossellomorea aquimaris]|uniref:hypothetical protein n=1 Tax=Rossellomorea aquimaris TaxID=189382 RepID=UPI0005CA86CB|nr:hypothetical protein [Rossellomorea aquimaris]